MNMYKTNYIIILNVQNLSKCIISDQTLRRDNINLLQGFDCYVDESIRICAEVVSIFNIIICPDFNQLSILDFIFL